MTAPSPEDLAELLAGASDEELAALVADLPVEVVTALLDDTGAKVTATPPEGGVIGQARELDSLYVIRPHLTYLSDRIEAAIKRVEKGESVYLAVSLPPRSGKTTVTSRYLPIRVLRKHPDWPVMLLSNSPATATKWGRDIRKLAKAHPNLGINIAPDAGAASEWETIEGGSVVSRSLGQSIVGRGAKVMVIDDPHKGLAEAHSEIARQKVWDFWIGDAFTRLDRGGHLVIVVQTRWHEDDLTGRLLSHDYEGDPRDWEVINLPAIAETADVLGREPGDPLLSPQAPNETREQALEAWARIREAVGSYAWAALYQGQPAPSRGAIFDVDWWGFWTRDPRKVTDDGKVVLWVPEDETAGKWLDSWDMAFKATNTSDYVVGQRWCRVQANRYLVTQTRAKLPFTKTLTAMKVWRSVPLGDQETVPEVPTARGHEPVTEPCCTRLVHRSLVEDKANGTAIIDVLKETIAGLIPVNPTQSKEARARAITPECESGNVVFPYPGDPGNEWVQDLLDELRGFPTASHDDEVDALTQALMDLRDPGQGSITVPGAVPGMAPSLAGRSITQTALSAGRRIPGVPVGRIPGR